MSEGAKVLYRTNVNNAYDLGKVLALIDAEILVEVTARPVRYQGGLSFAIYPCRVGDEVDGYVVDAKDADG